MPSTEGDASVIAELVEPEKPVDSGEKGDPDEEDPEEVMDEEAEYEEVEEVEEIETEEEVEVEEIEGSEADDQKSGDEEVMRDEGEEQEHAELLRLPPHGAEVYVGGIPHNASEAELKDFFESIGEVTEVCLIFTSRYQFA